MFVIKTFFKINPKTRLLRSTSHILDRFLLDKHYVKSTSLLSEVGLSKRVLSDFSRYINVGE